MKRAFIRWGSICLLAASIVAITACGGGGSGGVAAPAPGPGGSDVQQAIAAASAVAANDTSTNSSASFTALQDAGMPAVTVSSPPKVNFTVFSDGAVKTGLTINDLRFAIARLIPGTNGDPDQWVNYVSQTETATAGVGPGGTPVLATALQATSDGKMSAAELAAANLTSQLVYNTDGFYTYFFKTDIKDITKTSGVTFEPTQTHRVAIQLSYANAAGETIRVNPYYDFTLAANTAGGHDSVPVTDPNMTRKMTDVSSCNGCHEKLALHGGGRVDTQYCVMCHNPGTTDANSGNVLTLATMAHKIHAGRLLKTKLDAGEGGEDYAIWGFRNSKHDYAEVGFPQDLRNCTKCHSADTPAKLALTPQGDNWKTKPSKEACLSCHANKTGSDWDTSHQVFARSTVVWAGATAGSVATDLPNATCADCHRVGSNIAPERVHWNQNEENSAKYKMNIESAVFNDTADKTGRTVTVSYFLSDPTNGDATYNLVTDECTGAAPTVSCSSSTKFGNLRLYLAYQNMVGQSTAVTEYSAYNNGGNGANIHAYKGSNDGNNHYTVAIPLADDVPAVSVAFGTARVISIGQIKEPKLQVKAATDPRPEVVPRTLINVVVQNTFKELALSGTLLPRRTIVANEKCNVCHGALGTTSGSNTLAEAFHGGARNTVEACVMCHDPNRASRTVTTNGLALNESYQFKRMIHGIHGNSKRSYPFTHGNAVVDAFNKDGTSATGGAALAAGVENYAAEVVWPGVGINCNVCHVNNSYKNDQGTLGAMTVSDSLSKSGAAYRNPVVGVFETWAAAGACNGLTGSVAAGNLACTSVNLMKMPVISPKAASCTACHDSSTAMGHVTSFGGATFANRTQEQVLALPRETCDDCHSSGGFKGVDIVHGQK